MKSSTIALIGAALTLIGAGSCVSRSPVTSIPDTVFDIPYGAHPDQKMDLFLPPAGNGSHGVVILVHGGAWIAGDKSDVRDWARFLSGSGYVCLAVNYRLAPKLTFGGPTIDGMLDDLDLVKAYASARQAEWNCDASRIAFVGYSAGAHLSLMQALTRNENGSIRSCVSLAGPTDLTDPALHKNIIGVLKGYRIVSLAHGLAWDRSNPETVARFSLASPLSHASRAACPILLIHSPVDRIIPYTQAAAFREALLASGKQVSFVTAEKLGHDLDRKGYLESIAGTTVLPLLAETIR